MPPVFTNYRFRTLVIKDDFCDWHRKSQNLVSMSARTQIFKVDAALVWGSFREAIGHKRLLQAHDVPAKIIASISADLSTKDRICILWESVNGLFVVQGLAEISTILTKRNKSRKIQRIVNQQPEPPTEL